MHSVISSSCSCCRSPQRTHSPYTTLFRSMCGLGILLELMTNICDERGLGDLGKRLMLRFEPTGEIEEIVGVDAHRPRGKLPESLTVEESIRPADLSSLLVAHTMRGSAGRHGRLINHGELHRRPQPHCSSNCL